jgi:hypothetical protein
MATCRPISVSAVERSNSAYAWTVVRSKDPGRFLRRQSSGKLARKRFSPEVEAAADSYISFIEETAFTDPIAALERLGQSENIETVLAIILRLRKRNWHQEERWLLDVLATWDHYDELEAALDVDEDED